MSKSKGNVIDPIGLVDKYGADALRFTLCRLAVPGRDVKLSEAGVEAGRNFATKLWNAARYCEMNMCLPKAGFNPVAVTHPLNQWILHRLHAALCDVHAALDSYRFHDVADTLYHFVWDDFCDWYLEFTKPLLAGDNTEEVRATTGFVLQSIITTLHPVMPFITAELNERLVFDPISRWSEIPALPPVAEIDTLITMIRDIRSARSTLNLPAGAKLMAFIAPGADAFNAFCTRQGELLRRLGRLENITVATPPEKGVVAVATPFGTLYLDLKGQIDFAFEQARLSKEIDTLRRSLGQTQARLDDAGFVAKAPEEIIEEYKERLVQGRVREAQIQEALGRLVDVHSSQ
jgi:valyl-tRNA synthetase